MHRDHLAKSLLLSLAILGCGGSDSGSKLQDPCVRSQLSLTSELPDGAACYNVGYSDCSGLASKCLHSCAHDLCQAAECLSAEECAARLGAGHECSDYVVSGKSYGKWCKVSSCPAGTLGCPCFQGGTCGSDPYGSGSMTCSNNLCESACPYACRQGTSLCCGGNFCSGDCIGTPCC